MKKNIFVFIFFGVYNFFTAQIVNIPDTNFKNALLNHDPTIDINKDGQIQISEASDFTGILYLSGENISDLTGIEAFVKITNLICDYNQLTTLDLSKNIALTKLNCNQNELTNLDLTQNIALQELRCWKNQLTNLDLSTNTALKIIDCTDNKLTSLNFSKNVILKNINCTKNQLLSINITKNSALNFLVCAENQLTNLDISMNTNLTWLHCNQNQITNLDVSKNILLKNFNCNTNQLTSLDISNNPDIQFFYAQNNQLASLNLKNGSNSNLSLMSAYNNPNLNCIQVDNVTNANANNGWIKDDIANYNTECILAVDNTKTSNIKLYPNPVKDLLHCSEEVSTIKILDLSGKILKQSVVSGKSVDVSKLSKGNYLITIVTKTGQTITRKFIKE